MSDVRAQIQPVRRRGIFGLALIAVAMVAVLLALGFWQLQRKGEKRALIVALSERLAANPVPLPSPAKWADLTPDRDEFRRVTMSGQFQTVPAVGVYTSGSALRPDASGLGKFIFAPFRLSDGKMIVVDQGFVPDGAAYATASADSATLTGYIRFPEHRNWLTPKEDQSKRLWFIRDHQSMATAEGWGEVAPFYIDLESPPPSSGLPKPAPLQVHLKDDHLQYALTWFGLALVVAATFIAWAFGQRRR